MRPELKTSEAGQQYAAAHTAHYRTKDLREALQRYQAITLVHPETHEAGYARSQIQNIVNSVVPQQELLAAQVKLALAHVTGHEPPAEGAAPDASRDDAEDEERA